MPCESQRQLLNYSADLYERICCLPEHLEQLEQLPLDTEIRIQSACARTVFSVAETGTELAALPQDASIDGKSGQQLALWYRL